MRDGEVELTTDLYISEKFTLQFNDVTGATLSINSPMSSSSVPAAAKNLVTRMTNLLLHHPIYPPNFLTSELFNIFNRVGKVSLSSETEENY